MTTRQEIAMTRLIRTKEMMGVPLTKQEQVIMAYSPYGWASSEGYSTQVKLAPDQHESYWTVG